eukprot:3233694-Prymnesium_polylepis.1
MLNCTEAVVRGDYCCDELVPAHRLPRTAFSKSSSSYTMPRHVPKKIDRRDAASETERSEREGGVPTAVHVGAGGCLLYTSPSPRDAHES